MKYEEAEVAEQKCHAMSITSFLSDFSHEAVTVILPSFLATIGVGTATLGLIEGLSDGLSSFTKLGSGYYADKSGKKKQIIFLGYILTAIFPAIVATASGFFQVLFGRMLGWFGRGLRGPPRDAILTESVGKKDLGKAFGLHRAGDTLGAIAGPAAALFILSMIGYREVIWYAIMPGILAAIIFWVFVKDKFTKGDDGVKFFSSIRGLPKSFRGFLVGVGIFGISDFSHTLLIFYAVTTLTPEFGVLQASALAASFYIIRNIVYAVASFPVGYLGDRIGKKKILVAVYLLATLTFAGFIFLHPGVWTFVGLFALAGLYIAVEDSLEGAVSGSILKRRSRNMGFGVLGTVNGVGDFVSSMIVGVLWSLFTPVYGFVYTAILSFTGAVALAKIKINE